MEEGLKSITTFYSYNEKHVVDKWCIRLDINSCGKSTDWPTIISQNALVYNRLMKIEVVSRGGCQVSIFALQHFVDCRQIFA